MTTTRPQTFAAALRRGLVRGAISCAAFAVPVLGVFALPGNDFGVGTLDYVAPEHGAAAVDQDARREARQAERALAQCEDLPAGSFPSGVVLQWSDERGVVYSEAPRDVSLAYDLAVGAIEPHPLSLLDGFTLCR